MNQAIAPLLFVLSLSKHARATALRHAQGERSLQDV